MGFGGIGEMMFILLLGLLLFGPKKLPEIARQVGKVLGEFKKASAEFQAQLNDEVRRLETSVDTNTIAPTGLDGTAARNETPQYALEPNSGQHTGEALAESTGTPNRAFISHTNDTHTNDAHTSDGYPVVNPAEQTPVHQLDPVSLDAVSVDDATAQAFEQPALKQPAVEQLGVKQLESEHFESPHLAPKDTNGS